MRNTKKRRRKDLAELVDVIVELGQRLPACNRKYPQSKGETLFALDFINRKTSTQVSVSLGPAGGGFDGDDWPTGIGTGKPLKNSDPRTIPGVEK